MGLLSTIPGFIKSSGEILLIMAPPDSLLALHGKPGLAERLGLSDGPMLTKREIVSFSSPMEIWKLGLDATRHASPRQTLYQVTWR